MPGFELFGLLAIALAVWFWLDSLKAREAGVRAGRNACAAEGLQFLDDTVVGGSIRPVRDDDGRLKLRRVYHFEYSDTGNNRRRGAVTLISDRVVMLYLVPRLAPDPASDGFA
jgi:uncharacterized protein DUF3301